MTVPPEHPGKSSPLPIILSLSLAPLVLLVSPHYSLSPRFLSPISFHYVSCGLSPFLSPQFSLPFSLSLLFPLFLASICTAGVSIGDPPKIGPDLRLRYRIPLFFLPFSPFGSPLYFCRYSLLDQSVRRTSKSVGGNGKSTKVTTAARPCHL